MAISRKPFIEYWQPSNSEFPPHRLQISLQERGFTGDKWASLVKFLDDPDLKILKSFIGLYDKSEKPLNDVLTYCSIANSTSRTKIDHKISKWFAALLSPEVSPPVTEITVPLKRGPGRPRKIREAAEEIVKRPRGRPRIHPLPIKPSTLPIA